MCCSCLFCFICLNRVKTILIWWKIVLHCWSAFIHTGAQDTNTIVHQELKWKYPVDFFRANTRIMAGESSGWIYILMIYDRQSCHCTPQVFSTYRAIWLKIPRHTSPQRQSLHIFWAGKMNSHISHRWVLVEQDLVNARTLSYLTFFLLLQI